MYLSILLLPLLGSISAGLFGRKLGSTGSQIVTILCLVGASILASIAFYEVAICSSPISIYLTS
jgi:NADH-ubiquinone oxidoreductase chain 5